MATKNPDCTNGWNFWVYDEEHGHTVTAHCGCGWFKTGFPSKTSAKRAQRDHRFPPPETEETPCPPPAASSAS
jgi:hypothetical protein